MNTTKHRRLRNPKALPVHPANETWLRCECGSPVWFDGSQPLCAGYVAEHGQRNAATLR